MIFGSFVGPVSKQVESFLDSRSVDTPRISPEKAAQEREARSLLGKKSRKSKGKKATQQQAREVSTIDVKFVCFDLPSLKSHTGNHNF